MAALAGELEIRMAGGFVPAVGDTYTVVLAPSVTGTFAGGLTLPPGMAGNVIYSSDMVQVQFTALPEPGAMAGVMLLAAATGMRRWRSNRSTRGEAAGLP